MTLTEFAAVGSDTARTDISSVTEEYFMPPGSMKTFQPKDQQLAVSANTLTFDRASTQATSSAGVPLSTCPDGLRASHLRSYLFGLNESKISAVAMRWKKDAHSPTWQMEKIQLSGLGVSGDPSMGLDLGTLILGFG